MLKSVLRNWAASDGGFDPSMGGDEDIFASTESCGGGAIMATIWPNVDCED